MASYADFEAGEAGLGKKASTDHGPPQTSEEVGDVFDVVAESKVIRKVDMHVVPVRDCCPRHDLQ